MRQENERSPERRAFLHYIRTGQRVTKSFFTEGPPLELKFNPNHDPVNGRFTSGLGGGRAASRMRPVAAARRLPSGKLSAKYEAKGDPGRVSSGIGDIGGISYGAYQLSSKNGMAAAFICSPEARRYAAEFNQLIPGTEAFSAKWRAVAARDPAGFADAQHAFIARENYTRAVRGVSQATGFAIDEHSDTLREVVWSTAAQHGRAPEVIAKAVRETDLKTGGDSRAYEAALIREIYNQRAAHVYKQLQSAIKSRKPKSHRKMDIKHPRLSLARREKRSRKTTSP